MASIKRNTKIKPNFGLCRVCYASQITINLSSMFEGNGEKAKMFVILSGVNVFRDFGKVEALICDACLEELYRCFRMRDRIRNAEEMYFGKHRDIAEGSGDEINSSADSGQDTPAVVTNNEGNSRKSFPQKEVKPVIISKAEPSYALPGPGNSNEEGSSYRIRTFETVTVKQESPENIVDEISDDDDYLQYNEQEENSTEYPQETTDDFESYFEKESSEAVVELKEPIPMIPKVKVKVAKLCALCPKTFSDNYKLRRHVEGVHQKLKNFECAPCQKKFYRKFHLDRHNKRFHNFFFDIPTLEAFEKTFASEEMSE